MQSFFAPGKIMLAGEYLVTKGMDSLAFPVKKGQWLKVWETETKGNSKLIWQASDSKGETWFKAEVDMDIVHFSSTTDEEVASTLISIFQIIKAARPELFEHKTVRMETETEFPLNSGLGTSSALVVLLAQWAKMDAFEIQKQIFGGSGYDVAVCQTGKPIVYWLENEKPCWSPFSLDPSWTKGWHLVFPGNKKNSREALKSVDDKMNLIMTNPLFKWQLDQIVKGLKAPGNKIMLEAGLEMWQGMLSTLLGLKRTYDDLGIVPVPGGLCKYLGAWGGDTILVNDVILKIYEKKFEGMEQVRWNEFVIS